MSDALFEQSLVQAGTISACQLRFALAFQRSWGGPLEDVLVKLGLISSGQRASLTNDRHRSRQAALPARNEPMAGEPAATLRADG